ncbi:hypothetical protein [uncultured Algoriphagus sp.]|uniref:hypothetical protein n=1 Tax=uncultured Algoriphagus sp. TaxID=417365 RepID=UPI0030EDAB32|tara:strand:+ start:35535 stop:36131 length:597 start_codon:yes stop_codon:yes gene_type:complete
MTESEFDKIYDKLYVYTDFLVKKKKWFRKGKSDSFLKGKEIHDYIMDAVEKYLRFPEKYDLTSGRSLVNYLKVHIIQTLVGNDARSPENKTTSDLFAIYTDEGVDDPSAFLDTILPFLEEHLDDDLDYNTIMKQIEQEVNEDPNAESVFLGLSVFDMKRREIIEEFKMSESEYNNAVRRLNTIKARVAKQYDLKSKQS